MELNDKLCVFMCVAVGSLSIAVPAARVRQSIKYPRTRSWLIKTLIIHIMLNNPG